MLLSKDVLSRWPKHLRFLLPEEDREKAMLVETGMAGTLLSLAKRCKARSAGEEPEAEADPAPRLLPELDQAKARANAVADSMLKEVGTADERKARAMGEADSTVFAANLEDLILWRQAARKAGKKRFRAVAKVAGLTKLLGGAKLAAASHARAQAGQADKGGAPALRDAAKAAISTFGKTAVMRFKAAAILASALTGNSHWSLTSPKWLDAGVRAPSSNTAAEERTRREGHERRDKMTTVRQEDGSRARGGLDGGQWRGGGGGSGAAEGGAAGGSGPPTLAARTSEAFVRRQRSLARIARGNSSGGVAEKGVATSREQRRPGDAAVSLGVSGNGRRQAGADANNANGVNGGRDSQRVVSPTRLGEGAVAQSEEERLAQLDATQVQATKARQAVKGSPMVAAACGRFWNGLGFEGRGGVTRSAFAAMSVALHEVLGSMISGTTTSKAQLSLGGTEDPLVLRADVEFEHALSVARNAGEMCDADGELMSCTVLSERLFQLADMWVDSTLPSEYATFLESTLSKLQPKLKGHPDMPPFTIRVTMAESPRAVGAGNTSPSSPIRRGLTVRTPRSRGASTSSVAEFGARSLAGISAAAFSPASISPKR